MMMMQLGLYCGKLKALAWTPSSSSTCTPPLNFHHGDDHAGDDEYNNHLDDDHNHIHNHNHISQDNGLHDNNKNKEKNCCGKWGGMMKIIIIK